MDRTFHVAAAGAAVTAGILVLLYGPVVTAFVVAGTSFVLMIVMIALSGVQAVERWWRGHPWMLQRTKTH